MNLKLEIDRLDHFFFHKMNIENNKELAFVVKLVLTLSHGQASIERNFSVGKNCEITNMEPESIIGRKFVKDHMLSNNLKPHNMKIDDQFILDLKAAHSTYEQFLDKKKKQKNSNPELNVEKEAEEARKEQLVQTETDLAVLHAGISAAEDSIAAGSEEIQVLMCKKKKVDSATLAKSHVKISMGLKRKAELLNEVELVKEKKRNLEQV